MDVMFAVRDACVSGRWLTAVVLSVCCSLPSCWTAAGQTVDYSSVESVRSPRLALPLLLHHLLPRGLAQSPVVTADAAFAMRQGARNHILCLLERGRAQPGPGLSYPGPQR
ncbi:hypothetical protein NHX12_032921, partial [Muraenolepis orangiensis]